MEWTEIDESQLAVQAISDPEAFAALYHRYFERIYNYIRCRVQNPDIADELTSQVFERIMHKLPTFRPQVGLFAAWLWTIVRNVVNDFFRQQKRAIFVNLDTVREIGAASPDLTDTIIEQETRAELLTALKSLSEREQDLLGLKYWADLSNKEIAIMMGLSEANVAIIAYRATRRLAEQMAAGRKNYG